MVSLFNFHLKYLLHASDGLAQKMTAKRDHRETRTRGFENLATPFTCTTRKLAAQI